MTVNIRPVRDGDYPALLEIYNDVVAHTTAIYSDDLADLDYIHDYASGRIEVGYPFLVAEDESGQVLGYGTYGPFRARHGYRYTVEHSVYVASNTRGQGIGADLLSQLITLAKAQGYHLMIGAIDGENAGSIRFHERFGFKQTARIEQVAYKFDRWLDVVFMSLKLED